MLFFVCSAYPLLEHRRDVLYVYYYCRIGLKTLPFFWDFPWEFSKVPEFQVYLEQKTATKKGNKEHKTQQANSYSYMSRVTGPGRRLVHVIKIIKCFFAMSYYTECPVNATVNKDLVFKVRLNHKSCNN